LAEQNQQEKRIAGEEIFKGRILRVERDLVRLPNGLQSSREVVRHPGAVAIVAIKDQKVLLVRQYRYAIAQNTLEIPAGILEPQESPLDCAVRELREETGYRGTMEHICTFYSTPGFTDEVIHLYLAQNLSWDPLTFDDDEFIEVKEIPWDKAVKMVQQNEINDAKTILGIMLVKERIG
jgi:ADP-ribose pyrophosphatase